MRQTCPDVTAANQHDALVRLFEALQFAHHRTNVLGSGNKEDFVARFDNGGALWADRSVVTENRRNAGIDMRHMLPHR